MIGSAEDELVEVDRGRLVGDHVTGSESRASEEVDQIVAPLHVLLLTMMTTPHFVETCFRVNFTKQLVQLSAAAVVVLDSFEQVAAPGRPLLARKQPAGEFAHITAE